MRCIDGALRIDVEVTTQHLRRGLEAKPSFGFVDLDRRFVVDVGLGDGPSDPFPLEERSWTEGPLEFRLERLDERQWRFHNHQHGMAPSFDFTEEPRDLSSFQHMCTMLQTVEWSPFVSYAMAIRRTPNGFRAVRDRIEGHVRDLVVRATEGA